ncbi:hypothetical protein DPMN_055436 [Dreissena polymorpha]|uniref:Uncharacterized protein n=1 Tax=Dreissena polymorpha TaxID=45954 RepID=A0A9D4CPZ7_DREPO|nr:hypothetical protein DPMN_055436 [Dreissena polymorpha]
MTGPVTGQSITDPVTRQLLTCPVTDCRFAWPFHWSCNPCLEKGRCCTGVTLFHWISTSGYTFTRRCRHSTSRILRRMTHLLLQRFTITTGVDIGYALLIRAVLVVDPFVKRLSQRSGRHYSMRPLSSVAEHCLGIAWITDIAAPHVGALGPPVPLAVLPLIP